MKHVKALGVKFVSSLILLYVILGLFYDMSFSNVFLISLVLSISAYLIGDLFILSRTNNTIATIADMGLAFAIIWVMGSNLTYGNSLFFPSLISAIGLGVFEYFFHKYVYNHVIKYEEKSEKIHTGNLRYQTEASEELTPEIDDLEKHK